MMAPACLFYALMFLTCCVIVEGKGDESHPHLFFNPSSQVGADCPNCLPGVELLGMGWDATTGLHRPLRIVEFTFNNDFKFKNPQSGEIFAVPDQANAIPYTHLEAYGPQTNYPAFQLVPICNVVFPDFLCVCVCVCVIVSGNQSTLLRTQLKN